MKATEAKFLEFLRKSPQFIIPIYQRIYSWEARECQQLWDDILRAGKNDDVSGHFIGSIVYIEQGIYQVTTQSPLLVIDGQQRLTSVTLLLAAIAKHLDKEESTQREPIEGFSPRKIRNYYLRNAEEDGEKHFKLILSQTDKETLISIVGDKPLPNQHSTRVADNFRFFSKLIEDNRDDMISICKGLSKLVVVDVALNRSQDNPQLIFESMNSTGRELSQADLIRNYVLMGLEPLTQTRLYDEFWRPMEIGFGQEAYSDYFDGFMRHYLTVKTGDIPKINSVYEAFKSHASSPAVSSAGIDRLVKDLSTFAKYYCAIALGKEAHPSLKLAFQDLRELKVDVAYPLVLELYADYDDGLLNVDDFVQAVRIFESYVFRRLVCGIPTNSLNKTFSTLGRTIRKDRYLESIQANFLLLPTYRRLPSDDEFERELQARDMYNFSRRSYFLRKLENAGRKERVPVDEYTVEHIMPQNENLSDEWKECLGEEWQRVWEQRLHSLGNLTLTGYNSEYGDRSFVEKRDIEGGFKESPLKLNSGLGQVETWNEKAIIDRGERLAGMAAGVWTCPQLPSQILDAYRPTSETQQIHSSGIHPHLDENPTKIFFETFRKEVLALDPNIREEGFKTYIAFKAETNFVDVVPQSKRLSLTLNMPFPEIVDTRGVCRDVTNISTWGNGDVSVVLDNLDDLPYIIGLVRQALERQLGTENEQMR